MYPVYACGLFLLPRRCDRRNGDVTLPVPMRDPGDVPGTMKSDFGLEQREKANLEVLFGSESSPVKAVVEPDEPAAREVLRSFVKVAEDGTTPFDAAIDADPESFRF